ASLEADRDLDLVALFEKTAQVAHLHVVVAVLGTRTELELLDLDLLGLALGSVRLLLLFELELAEVHDAAYVRIGIGLDFYQVQAGLLGHVERLVARQHANLLAVCADHAHPRNTDFRILAVSLFSDDNVYLRKPGSRQIRGVQAAPRSRAAK